MTIQGTAQTDNVARRQAPLLFQWSVFPLVLAIVIVIVIVIAGSYALMIRGVNPEYRGSGILFSVVIKMI